MCRPNIVAKTTAPFLEIRAGRHPCVVHTFTGNEYIPNDTLINASQVGIHYTLLLWLPSYPIAQLLSCCHWAQYGGQVYSDETNWTDCTTGSSCQYP